jgi:hypothetical protein
VNGSRDGDFTLLELNGSELSLLAHPPKLSTRRGSGGAQLRQLRTADRARGAASVGWRADRLPYLGRRLGRQLQVASPDGLLVKINELDPELYG